MVLPYRNYHEKPSELYQYSTLQNPDTFRLLVIEPGTQDSEIRCLILQNSLTNNPIYEALSYTWGDPTKTHALRCGSKRIGVTANLHSALRYLRWPDFRRTLWVDAICINQKDVSEKTQQVQRMREIYAQAAAVLIWLGEEFHTDWRVFRLIEEFNEQIEMPFPEVATFTSRMMADDRSLCHAVARLLQRPWFRRVWIIQEVAMAAKARLICGTQKTDWRTLVRLIHFVIKNGLVADLGTTVYFGMVIDIMEAIRDSHTTHASKGPALLELLEKTQICSATDPRDRVFALLGIASDGASTGVVVDYSLEYSELYKQLANYNLAFQQSLSYLSLSGYQLRTPHLPSWVPDWSLNANPAPRSSLAGQGFKASGDAKSNISISPDGRELNTTGYVVETVYRVGKLAINIELPNPFMNNSSEFLQERIKEIAAIEECDDISSLAKPTYPSGEPLSSIYWRIIVCNRLFSGAVPGPEMAQVEPFFRYLMSHVDDIINQRDGEVLDIYMMNHYYDSSHYACAVGKWTSGRVFCATEGRYLGWLPRGAEKGDVVCILEGGEVPLVMRLANDGRYQVLGDCYIHGIMDGEAMKREGLVKEKFCIY
jgi:Heterokaryon incompatibility protein (HET)